LKAEPILFAHRYITRPSGNGEAHVELTAEEFEVACALGLFALEWSSHGLRYGIGIEIDAWLERGCTVVINGSRQHLEQKLRPHPAVDVGHIDAASPVLSD